MIPSVKNERQCYVIRMLVQNIDLRVSTGYSIQGTELVKDFYGLLFGCAC